jgi:hypothetical protein
MDFPTIAIIIACSSVIGAVCYGAYELTRENKNKREA